MNDFSLSKTIKIGTFLRLLLIQLKINQMQAPNKKIPGQSDKTAANLNADTQIVNGSPDDTPGENDITPSELDILNNAGEKESAAADDVVLAESMLDNKDVDGEILNEGSDYTGEDLDVPGSESDDEEELPGDEDEENSHYSHSDQDDDIEEEL